MPFVANELITSVQSIDIAHIQSPWIAQPVLSDCDKIYFVLEGDGDMLIGEDRFSLQPGRVFFIPQNTLQQADYNPRIPLRILWIHAHVYTINRLAYLQLFPLPKALHGPPCQAMQTLARRMLRESRRPISPAQTLKLQSEYIQLLAMRAEAETPTHIQPVSSHPAASGRHPYEKLGMVLDWMTHHYNEPITLNDLARQASLHPTHFCRTFKQAFGITPMRYLENIRMETAQRLLATTGQRIEEIANRCGYTDPFYFSRVFHRACGKAPTQYRIDAKII